MTEDTIQEDAVTSDEVETEEVEMKPVRKFRHWKQRFNPKAKFMFRKQFTIGDEIYKPGTVVPDGLLSRMKLLLWWEARYIELWEFEEVSHLKQRPVLPVPDAPVLEKERTFTQPPGIKEEDDKDEDVKDEGLMPTPEESLAAQDDELTQNEDNGDVVFTITNDDLIPVGDVQNLEDMPDFSDEDNGSSPKELQVITADDVGSLEDVLGLPEENKPESVEEVKEALEPKKEETKPKPAVKAKAKTKPKPKKKAKAKAKAKATPKTVVKVVVPSEGNPWD